MAATIQRVYDVGILLFPGADLLDFTGPHGVLSHVYYNNNPSSPDHVFKIRFIAAHEEITASDPVTVKRHISIADARKELEVFDVLIVPGGPLPVVQGIVDSDGPEYQFIKSYIYESKNEERVLMSICSGAFILGSIGILAGKTATTHTLALDGLKDVCHRATKIFGGGQTKVMKARYVDGGLTKSGVRIITTGGISCGFDGSLYLASLKTSESASNFAAMVLEYIAPIMDEFFESGNAFAIPELYQKSSLANFEVQERAREVDQLSPFIFSSAQELDNLLLFHPRVSFELPALDVLSDDPLQTFKSLEAKEDGAFPLSYGPLEDLEPVDQVSNSSDGEEQRTHDDPLEDLWSCQEILQPAIRQDEIKSWERFRDRSFKERNVPYISEAGPRVFDAAIDSGILSDVGDASLHQPPPAIRADAVLASLLQLALGRESLLIRYERKDRSFKPVLDDIRVSGYTVECFRSALKVFTRYGNQLRQAKEFVHATNSSKKTTAAFVALASGIETIITALQTQLSGQLASTRTVLQLQALLDPSRLLLNCLREVIEKAGKLRSDEDLLSMLYHCVQDSEFSSSVLRTILEQLLAHVSQPWLESIEGLLGLRASNMNMLAKARADDGDAQSPKMPDFIPSGLAETILEAEQSLKLLQAHKPNHLLARPHPSSGPPSLDWQFSWSDIKSMQAQAQIYESDILRALKEYNTFNVPIPTNSAEEVLQHPDSGPSVQSNPFGVCEIDSYYTDVFDPRPSALFTAVLQALDNSQSPIGLTRPSISLVPALSFQPLLAIQSRLLSHSTIHLLFHTHSLRSHLRLLYSYLLLANGPFLVRLSDALFDPSLPSAAYRKSRSRASGKAELQLGARDMAWPPASSELRIALMGILTESYRNSPKGESADGTRRDHGELPGDLSFAIRNDMSDIELGKCMNKDGLEALDFLKVQYRPPKPLDVIIMESVLDKYDRLSRLLLRGARVMFVVKETMLHSRESMRGKKKFVGVVQRFKVEASHFVTTAFTHFGDCVKELWAAYEKRLDGIEASIDCYDLGRRVEGVHRLRDLHEEVVDRMLAACLLRKRQELVMRLFEEILGLVLEFARCIRDHGDVEGKVGDVQGLYDGFRKKIRVFITVCRGLQDQKSVAGTSDVFGGGKRSEGRGDRIGRLVLALEMNGWYMR
ncbi:MAG: hypothetical protein Q9184_002390 [Pyrenodesmia sp. 2 TL-2023]